MKWDPQRLRSGAGDSTAAYLWEAAERLTQKLEAEDMPPARSGLVFKPSTGWYAEMQVEKTGMAQQRLWLLRTVLNELTLNLAIEIWKQKTLKSDSGQNPFTL